MAALTTGFPGGQLPSVLDKSHLSVICITSYQINELLHEYDKNIYARISRDTC
jgi:hypothetical protein